MHERNRFQENFLHALADVQQECVRTALCHNPPELEAQFYDLTADVLIRVLEILDGYRNPEIGPIEIHSGEDNLKSNPYLELHDAVWEFLKAGTQ